MPRSKKQKTAKRKKIANQAHARTKNEPNSRLASVKTAKVKTTETVSSVGSNRSEGIRLFKLAGRPTKEQFILVYGERGPKMTWEERAKAGVPAKMFQAALASKQSGR